MTGSVFPWKPEIMISGGGDGDEQERPRREATPGRLEDPPEEQQAAEVSGDAGRPQPERERQARGLAQPA